MSTVHQSIRIFIGYESRERAATNILIDSLYQQSIMLLGITSLVTPQLENQGVFHRQRDPQAEHRVFIYAVLGAVFDGLSGLGAVYGLRHALPSRHQGFVGSA